jgi:hypothetical protein
MEASVLHPQELFDATRTYFKNEDARKLKNRRIFVGKLIGCLVAALAFGAFMAHWIVETQKAGGLTHYDRVQMLRLVDKVSQ